MTEHYTKTDFTVPSVARIAAAIRAAFTGRGATKRVATAADANPRTASSWLYGEAAPRAPELIALMAANEKLEQQILGMVQEMRESAHCLPHTLSTSAGAGLASTDPPGRRDTVSAPSPSVSSQAA
jgi:hypothetical protein